jgi:hypothetical protein
MHLGLAGLGGETMAVRDNEQQRSSIDRPVRDLPWQTTIGHLPALLAIGAATLYGYLSICYTRFYGALKVDPSDVGLSYTGTLARSAGLVATLLVAITLIPFWQIPTGLPAPVRAFLNRRRATLNVALLLSVMSIAGAPLELHLHHLCGPEGSLVIVLRVAELVIVR